MDHLSTDANVSLPFELLWAKSSEQGGLPLIRHMLDVAAVAWELLDTLGPAAMERRARALSLTPPQTHSWLSLLVGTHDLGKATPGFQAKWPVGRERAQAAGFTFPAAAPDRHDAASSVLVKKALRDCGVDPATAQALADSVAAHHGFAITSTEHAVQARFPLNALWREAQDWHFQQMLDALKCEGRPRLIMADPSACADLAQWLAGLCSTADWIGSSQSFFPLDRPALALPAWWAASRQAARRALRECGLTQSGRPPANACAQALDFALPRNLPPRPLQQAVMAALQQATRAPTLVLIEAPMGEGKTEAAFVVDAWLRAQGVSRGLYLAMPTQATSNALFARLAAYLDRLHLPSPSQLQLSHGSASHASIALRLREIGFAGDDASVVASAWLTGSKRTLLSPNGIGTIDQALVAVLNAKHQFVRYFGLAGRLVVFDEVHAYDTYTGGLLEKLIAWLHAAGCSVVLMSATLPRARARALFGAFGAELPGPQADYPRLALASGGQVQATGFAASRTYPVSVQALSSELEATASHALRLAAQGAAVLVIVNKVGRAQQLYRRLAPQTDRLVLFHARFPMAQRLALEAQILQRFGPDGHERSGWIVVATQVAEQSLDVDFDALITDLAPIDLVLQRLGRVHRHARARPTGFHTAQVWIAGLEDGDIPPRSLTKHIYSHQPVLRTTAWLRNHPELTLPRDIDAGVQWVYGEDPVTGTSAAFEQACVDARTDLQREEQLHSQIARQAGLPVPAEWDGPPASERLTDDAAQDGMARHGTRLGSHSASVIPIFALAAGYSVLGEHADWRLDQPVPADIARQLAQRHLRVSHPLVLRALGGTPMVAGWDAHSDLQGHRPMVLDATGRWALGAMNVHLAPKLGLVFETASEQGPPRD